VIEKGGLYWWVAPTYGVALPGWLMLKKLCQQMIDAGVKGIEIRESDRQVIFPRGEIWIKSADNPDSLRGHGLDGVVLDEPAQIRSEAWYEVLGPALVDKKGWATFIGTPKGKNWLYDIWRAAATLPNWGRWRRVTVDNPYVDPAEIERERLVLSDQQFRQEYEADFGASQYLVYPEFDPGIHMWREKDSWGDPVLPEFVSFHSGNDFGGNTIGAHKSASAWAGRTAKDELVICGVFEEYGPNIGERQLNWLLEEEKKIEKLRRWQRRDSNPVRHRADKSQFWGIQLAQRMGINIWPTKGGKDSVEEGIELVHRRLQSRIGATGGQPSPRLFYLPSCSELVEQHFEMYRYDEPEEGKVQKRVPLKINDDLDDAIRYLVEDVDFMLMGNPQQLYSGTIPGLLAEPDRVKTLKERLKEKKRRNKMRQGKEGYDGSISLPRGL
jgi:hypothetical protein